MDASSENAINDTSLMDGPEDKKSVQRSASPVIHDKLSEGSVEHLDEWNVATALMSIDANHPAHPHHWPAWKKWFVAITYTLLETYIIWSSTAVINFVTYFQEEWHCSAQASNLVQSLFILGNAFGPMILGPMSDILGRKWVYVISVTFYIIFQIPQALAYNLPMMVINSAIAGICGSAAVANVASSMCDVFTKETVGLGMALFVWGANAGASIGSPIGEALAEKNWRWFYWMNMIVGGFLIILCILVPETLPASNVMNYAKKTEQTNVQISTLAKAKSAVTRAKFAFTMAARIFVTEPIIMALGLYNGFAYGINFLYLDGLFPVFKNNYDMSYMHANETFLNFLVGVTIVVMMQPIQDWLYRRDKKKNGGIDRPEARFLISLVTVWFFPLGLFWFAFTSSGNISWVSPLIAGGFIAVGDPQLWLAMLNYVTDSYPSVAGSAVAAFTLPSFTLAAVLVHLGAIMFNNMTTTWAMATLGFISLSLVLLIYVVYFFGHILRRHSRLAITQEALAERNEKNVEV
ncbi:plasma membrane pyridoxal family transmembrane transporter [Schizosaccharomyces osmophilus]|uniref:Plasma membrane pyridoxal family transmembrane transporter n=1 Tax=Schizosaccharomyces osmophilus TaxID=2545709 RepID=A0AAE9WAJ5_9SCHI|nr:plasma membrane pyridoxal family transmembrane transporter [Schizosaccharomyces osmophilus]WBW71871.1 plasma membrane pyridoxal family transmembrane transporter [Schizosaccharomyces osmophilus]